MGTNFYLEFNYCPTCGHARNILHLGKASCGWRFSFQKSDKIQNFEDFKRVINEGTIKDEYGKIWSSKDLIAYIEELQKNNPRSEDNNYVVFIDGYEFFEGDFS